MDINEVKKGFSNRHPWELSRTKCVFNTWNRYLNKINQKNSKSEYINIGAGDCFFDQMIIRKYEHHCCALDIGYTEEDVKSCNEKQITKYNDINTFLVDKEFDYAIMMDSLEYIDNDKEYINKLASRIVSGGYIFLTLPAHKKLFSEHDRIVFNKRRYDKADIYNFVKNSSDLEILKIKQFYFSLFLVRFFQVLFKLRIDPNHKVTTGWKYNEKSIITKLTTAILNIDYKICSFFRLPGLSLLVVLQKK